MPTLKNLYSKYKKDGLVVLAVHSDPDTESALKAAKDERMTYPVTFDKGKLFDALGAMGYPTFLLIDRKGVIRSEVWVDEAGPEIEKLLKES